MDDIFVARLMSTGLHTVSPETLVEDAAHLMLEHDIGSVVVVDDDNALLGILTSTDFVEIVPGETVWIPVDMRRATKMSSIVLMLRGSC